MATMTVSLPEPMKDWIEARVRDGEYASVSDYMRDLVRRDRAQRGQMLTFEELRHLLAASQASGIGKRSIDELFTEAAKIAAARGLAGE